MNAARSARRGDLDCAAEDRIERGVVVGHGGVLKTSAQITVRVSGGSGITMSAIFSSRAGLFIIGQGSKEPRAGNGPVPFGGNRRDAQAEGGLFNREAAEVTQLGQLGLERILRRERA